MPRPQHLPSSKPIEHLFFYKIFLCLVYADQTWYLYNTPDEDFGGWVGNDGGKEKAKSAADEMCKNRADRQKS
ncbi:hypothetical protein QT979_23085 [Microcoleus sp. w2-18bC1]|uniref:hypothetical protein n=1 Tax=unclassified Microcoleus TaxID=2642155 RepID=UPI002FD02A99